MRFTGLSLSLFIMGCQSFEGFSQVDHERDQEQQIAAQINASCETDHETAKELFDCTSASQGTIPVTHPQDHVDVDIEPDNYVEKLPPLEEPEIVNLWHRMRDQFQFDVPDTQRVNVQKNWYIKHPNYMNRVAKRAKPFLFHIVQKLEEEQLPMELALLPIVESAFDPFAYSHGRAAGMWQFIPSTGKRFGLKQNWWYDGRRDVVASTQGAIEYLKYLNNMFDGDWLHALAAYNSGEGRVQRAIRSNKRAGKPTDFWSLDLPRETRAYVPKLLALSDILRHYEDLGFAWPAVENAPFTEVVEEGLTDRFGRCSGFGRSYLKRVTCAKPWV